MDVELPVRSAADRLKEREARGALDARDHVVIFFRDRPWLFPALMSGIGVFFLGHLLASFPRYTWAQRRYALITVGCVWVIYVALIAVVTLTR